MRNGRTFHYVNAAFSRKNLTWWRTRRRRQPASWASSCGVARARDARALGRPAAVRPRRAEQASGTPPGPPRGDPHLSHVRTARTAPRRWGHPPLSVQPPFHPAWPSRRRRVAVAATLFSHFMFYLFFRAAGAGRPGPARRREGANFARRPARSRGTQSFPPRKDESNAEPTDAEPRLPCG